MSLTSTEEFKKQITWEGVTATHSNQGSNSPLSVQKVLKIIGVIIVIRMLATVSLVLGLGLFAGACTQQENTPTGETQPGTTTTEPLGTETPSTVPDTEPETPGTPETTPLPDTTESPTPSEPDATPSPDAT